MIEGETPLSGGDPPGLDPLQNSWLPVPLLLVGVVAFSLEQPWVWWAAMAALYVCAYLMRGLHAVTGEPQRSTALIGILFVVAFIWSSDAADAIPDLWNPHDATLPGM